MNDINILLENNVNVEKSLELFGDIKTYNETLKVFLKEIPEKLANIVKYKENGDMANYAILVHSLKSDCKYFGFEHLAEIAYKHEIESKANHIYYIYDDFDNLIKEAHKIINIVKKYFGEEIDNDNEESEIVIKDKTILVVDDSDIIRSFVSKIFNNNYEVLVAHDGKEAIDLISNNNSICCILLDLNMPNVNGFSVLNYLKDNNLFEKMPTSIMTGVADDQVIYQTTNYPIVSVLRKPFNEKSIKAVLNKMLK